MRRLALLFLFAPLLSAADDRVAAVHALLVPMRGAPLAEARGATPALTNVKHQLRDWIEFHLAGMQWKDDRLTPNPTVLQEQLNDELSRADLFCEEASCPQSDHAEHLIVTTGVFPWCSSVWQPVYYRVWQTRSTLSAPLLLLDGSELADIFDPIHVRADRKDVFIEYQIIADDANRVSEFRHYVVENGKLRRTDPVALTPQDFVSLWLRHGWSEVSEWTARTGRTSLEAWRQRYKGTYSEFTFPARHCTGHSDLWQVATDPNPDVYYFLIRARPPFRFTMVAASGRPWPDCTEDDPAIDNAPDIFDQ